MPICMMPVAIIVTHVVIIEEEQVIKTKRNVYAPILHYQIPGLRHVDVGYGDGHVPGRGVAANVCDACCSVCGSLTCRGHADVRRRTMCRSGCLLPARRQHKNEGMHRWRNICRRNPAPGISAKVGIVFQVMTMSNDAGDRGLGDVEGGRVDYCETVVWAYRRV